MKREIGLFAAIGGLFFTPASDAQLPLLPGPGTHNGVTCVWHTDTSGQYPGNQHFLNCIGTGTGNILPVQGVYGTIRGSSTEVRNRLNNGKVTFYFFRSKEDYQKFFNGAGQAAYDGLPGWAGKSEVETARPYTVVFLTSAYGTYTADQRRATTAHEAGHHLDFLWRSVLKGTRVSNSAKFIDLLNHDWFWLDYSKNGTVYTKRPACGSGGALVNLWDPTTDRMACEGNQLYTRTYLRNSELLRWLYPYHFQQRSELFPEIFAMVSGNRVYASSGRANSTPGAMIASGFACTRALVSSLNLRGADSPAYGAKCTQPLPVVELGWIPPEQ